MEVKKNKENPVVLNNKVIVARFIFTLLLMGVILFLSAGTFNWWEGWAYLVMTVTVLVISRVILILKYPETAVERMNAGSKEDTKSWDKVLVPLIALYMPMVSWVISGLDKRFGWSGDLQNWIQIVALLINFAASMFSTWAMFRNRFFSSHVRIQKDRGHIVVKDGPYAIVRHPGYAGGIISWLTAAPFFSSWWVLIPMLLTIAGYIYRTRLEDDTLQAELPGYKAYTQEVRYRLLPGIW